MEPKPWFVSKLNRQAILNMVAGLVLYLAGDKFVVEYAPALIPVLVFVNGVIMMVLRTFLTSAPIAQSLTGMVPETQRLQVQQSAAVAAETMKRNGTQ